MNDEELEFFKRPKRKRPVKKDLASSDDDDSPDDSVSVPAAPSPNSSKVKKDSASLVRSESQVPETIGHESPSDTKRFVSPLRSGSITPPSKLSEKALKRGAMQVTFVTSWFC